MKTRTFLSLLPALLLAPLAPAPLHAAPGQLKILKFEADWCGACKQMKPAFNSVASEFKDVSFQTVDVDRQTDLADSYKVEMLPTIVAVKDGRVVGRLVGAQSVGKLKSFVKKHR